MREADVVEAASGFLDLLDTLIEFVGDDKAKLERRLIKDGDMTESFLFSLRNRKTSPPKKIGHAAYLVICRCFNELAWKAAKKTERLVAEAEASDVGIDRELWGFVCRVAERADQIEMRLAATDGGADAHENAREFA